MRYAVLLTLLLMTCPALAADEQYDRLPTSLQKYFSTLADFVHAAGSNRSDRALETIGVESNPAFRNPEDRVKFKEAIQKLVAQVGKLRPKFESFDVVAVTCTSSQAYSVHGVANGERGPMHFDFEVFYFDGRWHMHGLHFNAGWKRDKELPSRVVFFDKPVVLRLDQPDVASR